MISCASQHNAWLVRRHSAGFYRSPAPQPPRYAASASATSAVAQRSPVIARQPLTFRNIDLASVRYCKEFRGGHSYIFLAQRNGLVVLKVNKTAEKLWMSYIEKDILSILGGKKGIVPLLDAFPVSLSPRIAEASYCALVLPYRGPTLSSWMHQKIPFHFHSVLWVSYCLLNSLAYAHSKCIAHSDFHSSNILVNNEGDVTVADWGNASFMPTDTLPATSLTARAPEVFLEHPQFDTSIDIWGYACVVYALTCGKQLYSHINERQFFSCLIAEFGMPSAAFITKGINYRNYFTHLLQPMLTPPRLAKRWDMRMQESARGRGWDASLVIAHVRRAFVYENRPSASTLLQDPIFDVCRWS